MILESIVDATLFIIFFNRFFYGRRGKHQEEHEKKLDSEPQNIVL
jgi:hypothetical protein